MNEAGHAVNLQQPFVPTEAERIAVAALSMGGMPQRMICQHILRDSRPIDHRTLRKHFKPELTESKRTIDAMMYHGLVYQALVMRNVAAVIFYLKTQCGWREPKQELEVNASGDRPVKFTLSFGTSLADRDETEAALDSAPDMAHDGALSNGEDSDGPGPDVSQAGD